MVAAASYHSGPASPASIEQSSEAPAPRSWTVVPAADETGAACEPASVTAVVHPPNQTTAALRPWTFGAVCQHGRIDQNAYVPGSTAF